MDKQKAVAVLKEVHKRTRQKTLVADLRSQLFEQQLKFLNDPSEFKIAMCSRRAGKTHVGAAALIETVTTVPDADCAYVALSFSAAKRIMWRTVKKMCKKQGINVKFHETDLAAEFPNGNTLYMVGANDLARCETLRGIPLALVVIDEAASFRSHIRYLIDEVLTPAMIDKRGTLMLIGTPPARNRGVFAEAAQGKDGFSVHHWTLLDNPYIKDPAGWLESYRKKKGWSETNPIYLREYRGILCESDDLQVFKFKRQLHVKETVPEKLSYILGVDLGYEDASAFVVLGYSEHDPCVHVIYSYKCVHMQISDIAQKIRDLQERYNPVSTVCDTGGLGKSIVEEIKHRHSLSIKAAEKQNKYEYVELLNSDLHECKLLFKEGQEDLFTELEELQWDEDKDEMDSRYENHLADAVLYAWREAQHYLAVPEIVPDKTIEAYYIRREKLEEQYLIQTKFDQEAQDDELYGARIH